MRELPLESRLIAMQQGGKEYLGWSLDTHLLASILDSSNSHLHTFICANSKKKPKAPKPVRRPGDAERKKEAKQNNPFAKMVQAQMNKLKTKGPQKIVIKDEEGGA